MASFVLETSSFRQPCMHVCVSGTRHRLGQDDDFLVLVMVGWGGYSIFIDSLN